MHDDEEEEGWDYGDDEEEPTIPCPHCRREIHEDSPRCPYCEKYLSDEDAPAPRKPWWIIIGALLVMYIVLHWVAGWP